MSLPSDNVPSQADFGLLRAYLAQRKFTQSQITAAIGNNPSGRIRAEIVSQLINWLRSNTMALLNVVPDVTVLGITMPLSSQWTYDKIILPISKALGIK